MRQTAHIARAWRDVHAGKLTPGVRRYFPMQAAAADRLAQQRRIHAPQAFALLARAARHDKAPRELRALYLPAPPVGLMVEATTHAMRGTAPRNRDTTAQLVISLVGAGVVLVALAMSQEGKAP